MPKRLYHEQESETECNTVSMTGRFRCPCGLDEERAGHLTFWVQGGYILAMAGTMADERVNLILTPGDLEYLAERLPVLAARARGNQRAPKNSPPKNR